MVTPAGCRRLRRWDSPQAPPPGVGAPADRVGRSGLWRGRCALIAEKVEGLPEVFAWRHHVCAVVASAIGRSRRGGAPGGRVGGDLFFERLEIGGSRGRRGRGLRRGRGGDRQFGQRPNWTSPIAKRPVAASWRRLCGSLRLSRLRRLADWRLAREAPAAPPLRRLAKERSAAPLLAAPRRPGSGAKLAAPRLRSPRRKTGFEPEIGGAL